MNSFLNEFEVRFRQGFYDDMAEELENQSVNQMTNPYLVREFLEGYDK